MWSVWSNRLDTGNKDTGIFQGGNMRNENGPFVVVTGGASGIGASCCRLLASKGWSVIVADISDDAGSKIAEEIGGVYRRIDVADADAVDAAAAAIEAEFGPLGGLVNCAGVIQPTVEPERLAMELWDRIVEIDQRGTYVACLSFGRRMAASKAGSIVNIASIAGSRSMPLHSYAPAKAAVISMTSCLASAWGGEGVRVNSVSPGYTATPGLQVEIDAGRRDVSRLSGNAALRRLVKPEEIAEAVAFLLSPAASAISGIDLPVDCGWLAGSTWQTYGGLPPVRGE
jgi:NAD(P)-dependent dehydrogenase (short-subunit alcohol dehydrogenase family)